MPVVKTIKSPHRFPERILGFGDGGSGKSTAVLSMARYMPESMFYVVDTDVSYAYDRLLALEFQDVEERGNLVVEQATDWDEFVKVLNGFNQPDTNDPANVLVVDNGTFPWVWVQDQHIQVQYGIDLDEFYAKLRRETAGEKEPAKAYAKALADAMQWPIINKKYNKGFYRHFHKWKGHALIMCESRTTKGEKDQELLDQFQYHGAMPKGQGDLPYIMATNLLFMTRGKDKWAVSATKDRGRVKVDKKEIDDFAMDYLVGVAGWEVERIRV